MQALPGVAGSLKGWEPDLDGNLQYTHPENARQFVQNTGIDALAINIGQVHLHGRQTVSLNFDCLNRIREVVRVPLVLHGASSVDLSELTRAAQEGIRKINVGSVLKQTYFEAMRRASIQVTSDANPYEIIGAGMNTDVLTVGRLAMQDKVEDLMRRFGSAGMA